MYNTRQRLPKHLLAYYANHGHSPLQGWGFGKGGLFYKLSSSHPKGLPINGGMAFKSIEREKMEHEGYKGHTMEDTDELNAFYQKVFSDNTISDEDKLKFFKSELIDLNKNYTEEYISTLSPEQQNKLVKDIINDRNLIDQYLNDLQSRMNMTDEQKEEVKRYINEESVKHPYNELYQEQHQQAEQEYNNNKSLIPQLEQEIKDLNNQDILIGRKIEPLEYELMDAEDEEDANKIIKIKNQIKLLEDEKMIILNLKKQKEKILYDFSKPSYIPEIIRGNISEDILTQAPMLLNFVDKDNSTTYNTKNPEAYNPDFIDLINKKYPNELYDLLQYVPVDIIKGNTIWELKSYSKSLYSKYGQVMQKTKLQGYDGSKISYNFIYDNPDNPTKIINIEAKIGNTKVNILKDNPRGYNYYWGFNSSNGFGYLNPLRHYNDIKNKTSSLDPDYFNIDNKKVIKMSPSYVNRFKNLSPQERKGQTLWI